MSDLPKKLSIYFDGSCEPKNPGGWATYGWIIRSHEDESVIKTGCGVAWQPGHRFATNNCAEYASLGKALRFLADEGWEGKLEVYGDSQVVIYQLTEKYATNDEKLKELRTRIMVLLEQVGKPWSAHWIERDKNEAADALSRIAYEQATGEKFPERKKKKK